MSLKWKFPFNNTTQSSTSAPPISCPQSMHCLECVEQKPSSKDGEQGERKGDRLIVRRKSGIGKIPESLSLIPSGGERRHPRGEVGCRGLGLSLFGFDAVRARHGLIPIGLHEDGEGLSTDPCISTSTHSVRSGLWNRTTIKIEKMTISDLIAPSMRHSDIGSVHDARRCVKGEKCSRNDNLVPEECPPSGSEQFHRFEMRCGREGWKP